MVLVEQGRCETTSPGWRCNSDIGGVAQHEVMAWKHFKLLQATLKHLGLQKAVHKACLPACIVTWLAPQFDMAPWQWLSLRTNWETFSHWCQGVKWGSLSSCHTISNWIMSVNTTRYVFESTNLPLFILAAMFHTDLVMFRHLGMGVRWSRLYWKTGPPPSLLD